MTLTDIRSLRGHIRHLKAAYPPLLNTSGLRLERSLTRYMMTVARLRRSRGVQARSLACLARLARLRANQSEIGAWTAQTDATITPVTPVSVTL